MQQEESDNRPFDSDDEMIEELPPEWENLDHIPDLSERPDLEEQLDIEYPDLPAGSEELSDGGPDIQAAVDEHGRPLASTAFDAMDGEAWPAEPAVVEDPFIPIPYVPASQGETIRRSGLAWSAGVAFFGSVAFTLFLGWLADLLLGTSPWGIVGGIVLGSIIGFVQFFRITSQIFPSKDNGPEIRPLMSRNDDERH